MVKAVGYITSVYGGQMVKIYSVESVSDSKQINYEFVSVLGSPSPIVLFSSGDARRISFSLHFFARRSAQEEVKGEIDKLKKMAEPRRSGFLVIPPPPVILRIGNAYKMKGVIENIQVGEVLPPMDLAQYPIKESVSLEVVEVVD